MHGCSMVASTEGEERMAPGTFLVSVSLERFFSDERARCYMAVDGSRRTRWLARRLRRTFALPGRVALLCRGHLLPPAEPLALLRHGDELQAIPATALVVDISRDATSDYEESPSLPAFLSSEQNQKQKQNQQQQSLEEMKSRALALLTLHEPVLEEQQGEEKQHEEQQQGAGVRAIRRRRRVRRRRREPLSAPDLPETETEIEPMQIEPETETETETKEEFRSEEDVARFSADLTMEVIRNSCGGQRAPRRVSALAL